MFTKPVATFNSFNAYGVPSPAASDASISPPASPEFISTEAPNAPLAGPLDDAPLETRLTQSSKCSSSGSVFSNAGSSSLSSVSSGSESFQIVDHPSKYAPLNFYSLLPGVPGPVKAMEPHLSPMPHSFMMVC
jgi:hypothetical protein